MRLLFLCDEYPPGRHGGIGIAVQTLAKQLVAMGHEIYVVGFYHWGYGGLDAFDDEGVKVFRFRRILDVRFFENADSIPVRIALRIFKALGILEWDIKNSIKAYHVFVESIIKKHAIQLIEKPDYNDYMRYCKTVVNTEQFSVPTLLKLHGSITVIEREIGNYVPENIYTMEKKHLSEAEYVTAVSHSIAINTCKEFGCLLTKNVLYNGVNTTRTNSMTKVDGRVVFIGALTKGKGIYQLAKAWNIVIESCPYAELYIFGKGHISYVQGLLTSKALKTVYFSGHIPDSDVLRELAEAEVCVLPSYSESFGLAAFEAMICKTALIYTKRSVGPEFITDEENGLLVDPNNINEIALSIIRLLNDKTLNRQIASNGHQYVKEHFDIKEIARKHVQFYEQVIESKRASQIKVAS